jgi:hypothetical protein
MGNPNWVTKKGVSTDPQKIAAEKMVCKLPETNTVLLVSNHPF